jgi:hypothetical protein
VIQQVKSKKGTMISYSHASVYSSKQEEYVLKIHGQNLYDIYIQLGDFITMESWQACLNQDIMKQQQEIERKITSSNTYSFATSSSITLQQQTVHDITSEIGNDGREENDDDDVQLSFNQVIVNNEDGNTSNFRQTITLLSPPPLHHYTRRRRSKSHPSILSKFNDGDENSKRLLQEQYPLLFSSLSSSSILNTSLSSTTSIRKRRITSNDDIE